jgi:hypothetical protein
MFDWGQHNDTTLLPSKTFNGSSLSVVGHWDVASLDRIEGTNRRTKLMWNSSYHIVRGPLWSPCSNKEVVSSATAAVSAFGFDWQLSAAVMASSTIWSIAGHVVLGVDRSEDSAPCCFFLFRTKRCHFAMAFSANRVLASRSIFWNQWCCRKVNKEAGGELSFFHSTLLPWKIK